MRIRVTGTSIHSFLDTYSSFDPENSDDGIRDNDDSTLLNPGLFSTEYGPVLVAPDDVADEVITDLEENFGAVCEKVPDDSLLGLIGKVNDVKNDLEKEISEEKNLATNDAKMMLREKLKELIKSLRLKNISVRKDAISAKDEAGTFDILYLSAYRGQNCFSGEWKTHVNTEFAFSVGSEKVAGALLSPLDEGLKAVHEDLFNRKRKQAEARIADAKVIISENEKEIEDIDAKIRLIA